MPFFDMRCTWPWVLIWDGSISGNISLTEVSKPAKFHAFIIKRTFLVVSSWINRTFTQANLDAISVANACNV